MNTVNTITPDTPLGALVTAHPELARELERRGLDYCCGGSSTLDDACRRAGISVATTVDELAAALDPHAETPEWASMGAVELVDHLEATHHRYLWDEMPRLSTLVAKIAEVHGERHPELHDVARLYEEIRADLTPHLLKEERVLFPMIRVLADASDLPAFSCGSVRNPISVMLTEHDRVGDLLAEIRRATHDFEVPADGCASYRAAYDGLHGLERDTHLHVHKENNVLFPLVVALESDLATR